MSKNAMPVSKAKTAYGLLSEIRKLILAEPKRYDQHIWKRAVENIPSAMVPACGTVCCVAGWVDTLKSPEPIAPEDASAAWEGVDYAIATRARDILGINMDQRLELFGSEAAGSRMFLKDHAKRGAAHIAKFQKKYAAQLKAKRV